jgi:hypothetical protein
MSDEMKHEHTFYWGDCYAVYCGVCGLRIADEVLLDEIGELYKYRKLVDVMRAYVPQWVIDEEGWE